MNSHFRTESQQDNPHHSKIKKRYEYFLLLVGIISVSTGLNIAFAQTSVQKLTWSPPALTNPITINLNTGKTSHTLDNTKDYIIKFPTSKKVGSTTLVGGRNIVMIGGYISIPVTDRATTTDLDRRAIYIKENTGTVHIEGILIDGSAGGESDAIAINSPLSTVQIQNVRAIGLTGTDATMHADVIQPWGGVKELRVDRLTGESYYQGIFLAPETGTNIAKSTLKNVNLRALGQAYGGGGGGYMLTFTKYACSSFPAELSEVYVEPRVSRPLGKTLWPDIDTAATISCAVSVNGNTANWSSLPITGIVKGGAPTGGDFVPNGLAGLGYVSPGYIQTSVVPSPAPNPTPAPVVPTPTPLAIPPTSPPSTPVTPGSSTYYPTQSTTAIISPTTTLEVLESNETIAVESSDTIVEAVVSDGERVNVQVSAEAPKSEETNVKNEPTQATSESSVEPVFMVKIGASLLTLSGLSLGLFRSRLSHWFTIRLHHTM